ncbi:transcriptional regulator, LacI family [Corynebacterium appendicis CIP 107643]|uniref:Transcriptional regulator, LacI family n=1 Tax=Corynebacterium appendicis CIP 107643 TaxID=1161099 RepID=A0A1N7J6E1_9CORY|nr:LacI family DNA-binding transcriptional regulator [Corynebacterium appendicis]WJY61832.1 HTH-type transcriptional regulator GntR [Corynebacterium appendicis CIP 107643]SIS44874.1 transcriptional regulator, LacI family [Corynebacterium appendicis CIP 107643]
MAQRRGTLASIAAEVGVSRTTVSNAYNHPDQLSPELRERILAAARARGYTGPDPTARSLRTRQAGAVGVILTEHLAYAFEDQASIDFLAGLSESSAGAGNALTLIPLGPNQGSGLSPLVASALVDAFVVYSVPHSEPHLDAVLARGVPVVVCDQPYTGAAGAAFVGIDDASAIAPAARALVEAGHRRIGIVGKRLFRDENRDGIVTAAEVAGADMHVQRGRIQGALDVFAAAGITGVPVVTRHFNDHSSAVDAARELFGHAPDLTAVLCTTDSMAFGVLDYCARAGLDVPGDVSVTGFDGVERAVECGLTTVIQHNKRKGETVGRLLTELLEAEDADAGAADAGPDAPPRVILPTEFSSGRTVAPPRAR